MLASRPFRRRWGRSLLTPTRITTAILCLLVVLEVVLTGRAAAWLIGGYLALVLVTALVVRGVRQEPGSWLGRRTVRRGIVVLLGAICIALIATPTPASSGDSSGLFVLFLLLIVLNVALGRATQRIATAPDAVVDERQEMQRNRAHRISYSVLAAVVGGITLVADIASPQTRSWLQSSLGGGGWIAFLELLFVLPAMVMAFLDRDTLPADDAEAAPAGGFDGNGRLAAALLGLTLAVPLVLSLALLVVPVHTASVAADPFIAPHDPATTTLGAAPNHCREFSAQSSVGAGVTAVIDLHAQACWDGTKAYESFGMNASDCIPASTLLSIVTTALCQRTTTPDGTLSFTYRSQVSSVLLPFLHREVTLRLVIDRNGTVEEFP